MQSLEFIFVAVKIKINILVAVIIATSFPLHIKSTETHDATMARKQRGFQVSTNTQAVMLMHIGSTIQEKCV